MGTVLSTYPRVCAHERVYAKCERVNGKSCLCGRSPQFQIQKSKFIEFARLFARVPMTRPTQSIIELHRMLNALRFTLQHMALWLPNAFALEKSTLGWRRLWFNWAWEKRSSRIFSASWRIDASIWWGSDFSLPVNFVRAVRNVFLFLLRNSHVAYVFRFPSAIYSYFFYFFIIDFIWPWFGSVCITHFDLFAFTIKCYRFFYLFYFSLLLFFIGCLSACLCCDALCITGRSAALKMPFTSNLWRRCVCTTIPCIKTASFAMATAPKPKQSQIAIYFFVVALSLDCVRAMVLQIAGPISIR